MTRLQWVALVSSALFLAACATDEYGNRRPLTDTEKGALFGAAGGAVLGSLSKDRTRGVLIGAVGGGIAGGLVGNYMDNQRRDLEKVLAPERAAGDILIDKLPNNVLRITMTDRTAFEIDSAEVKPDFDSTMDKIAQVLKRYGKTHLDIVGHTDNTGSAQHNQLLSERRAGVVLNYFSDQGVIPQRLASSGKGEREPRASNATAAGRQLNRRVEIFVEPVVADNPNPR